MMLNGMIAWNMAAKTRPDLRQRELKRYEYMEWLADDMLNFREETAVVASAVRDNRNSAPDDPRQYRFRVCEKQKRCAVCQVDSNYSLGGKKGQGVKAGLSHCLDCSIDVHNHKLTEPRRIHGLPDFVGMACHEIYCSKVGRKVWQRSTVPGDKAYHLQYAHPIIQRLKEEHANIPPPQRKRARVSTDAANVPTTSC